MMSVKQLVECVAGEKEVTGRNLPLCRCVHYKFHMTGSGLEAGTPRWEAGD
jgi:hypothetical protein